LHDNHEFMIKALTHRMKKSDFRFLNPEIQNNYAQKLEQHEMVYAQQKKAAEQASMGMVPMGGFLTTVNTSWFNPSTNRVERVKIPSEAISWLMQKLQTQGQFANEVQQLPLSSQASIGASTESSQPQADNVIPIGPQA